MSEPLFFNGSYVLHNGAEHCVYSRSTDAGAVTYNLIDGGGERLFNVSEAELEPRDADQLSKGPKAAAGVPGDGAALAESFSIVN